MSNTVKIRKCDSKKAPVHFREVDGGFLLLLSYLLRGQDNNLSFIDGVCVRGAVGAALEDRYLVLLLSALNSIAVLTKHLAVFYCGLAAIVPRVYVVCFHFSYFKVIAAVSANAALLLIYFYFGLIVKLPQAQ